VDILEKRNLERTTNNTQKMKKQKREVTITERGEGRGEDVLKKREIKRWLEVGIR
jgi:hypothetical protein